MMVRAKLKRETQVKIWAESVNCIGFLVNVILKVDQNEPSMEACTVNSSMNWFNCLVQFGRIGNVLKKIRSKSKL